MPSIQISQDHDTESPRTAFDNQATFLSVHKRYELGDKKATEKLLSEIRESKKHSFKIEEEYDISYLPDLFSLALKMGIIAAYKNLYCYEHGDITIATTPFSCRFDSGQFGIAYITKKEACEIKNVKRITKKVIKELESVIEEEVSEFDTYIRGEVYHFSILDDDDNVIDSCGGFYTNDFEKNGMKEQIDEKYHYLLVS